MAIKYLAGNRLVSDDAGDTKPTLTAAVAGTTFLDVAHDLYRWDGDSWEIVTGNTLTEDMSGKTFTDYMLVAQRTTPGSSVGADKGAIYVKADGKFYGKFENDSEIDLTVGAGATTLGGLSDVTISNDAAGHIVVRNAADNGYVNLALSGATGTTATLSGTATLGITTLTALTDLDMTDANHTIFDNMSGRTLTIGASDTAIVTGQNLTVTGDLVVSGTTTTLNTQTLSVEDPLILLSNGASGLASVDSGLVVERGNDTNVAFVWDESEDEFGAFATSSDASGAGGNMNVGAYQDLRVGGLVATTGAFSGVLSATSKILVNVADATNVTAGADGHLLHIDAVSLNDNTTAEDGTAAAFNLINIEAPTITVANDGVTVTRAATVLIGGAPADGDSELTITNAYALYVAGGTSHFVGAVSGASSITGATLVSTAATTANSLVVTTTATVGGTLGVTGVLTTTVGANIGGALAVTGATTLNGAVALGNASGDDITFPGYIASHLYPKTDGTYDIGEANGTREWRNLFITGTAYLDAIATGAAIDTPAITGGTAIELTVLSVRDNAASFDLELQSATTGMDADRVLIFNVNNVDRTVSLAGNVTFAGAVTTAGAFITSGANSLTLTTTGATNVTLPVTGTVATLAGNETLTTKTINSPKIGTALLDSAGDEMIKFTPSGGTTVNEFTFTNTAANGSPSIAATGTDPHINLTLKSKGTDGVIIASTVDNGAYLEFQQKAAPATMTGGAVEYARLYLKEVDTNNNALACKIQKAGAVVEVEITSPKAICGVCGSKDGAKDPTYDFSRSMMLVELWCGHSYEVPMNGWNMVS